MSDVPIQIVDEHDRPIGAASKQQAWKDGLLQHRHPNKDIFPNRWDIAVAGHVDAGESYQQAAYRELAEELGITGVRLEPGGIYFQDGGWQNKKMKRFNQIFVLTYDQTPIIQEPDKIDDVRWFTRAELAALVRDHPDQVADSLVCVHEHLYKDKT